MTSRPAVTIGMPAFNSDATLERAIASVRAQSFKDWRLVISDDTSADGTWEKCLAAEAADPRIVAIRNPSRRMFMNFETALGQAETPYFAWLSADDAWAPAFLEASLDILTSWPRAVSALPRCKFFGQVEGDAGPSTLSLDGPASDRLRRYFAAPGGTRMYGLFKTDVLRASFPRRNMNAYDWFLMAGVLRAGPQIEVPSTLLYREKTDFMKYVEIVDELHASTLFRRFPVARMSISAVMAGHIPADVYWDLIKLNLRKHEEYLAVMRPRQYARRLSMLRRLGLPISSRPGKAAEIAARIAREHPERRAGAAKVLERLISLDDPDAALETAHLRRDGVLSGDAVKAYAIAAQGGVADGRFYHAITARTADIIDDGIMWTEIVAAAHGGSQSAISHLQTAAEAERLPERFRAVVDYIRSRAENGRAA